MNPIHFIIHIGPHDQGEGLYGIHQKERGAKCPRPLDTKLFELYKRDFLHMAREDSIDVWYVFLVLSVRGNRSIAVFIGLFRSWKHIHSILKFLSVLGNKSIYVTGSSFTISGGKVTNY